MILKEEERAVLALFPDKSPEKLIPVLEDSMEAGGPFSKEILASLLAKIRREAKAEE